VTGNEYDIKRILADLRDGYRRGLEEELPTSLDQCEVLCFRIGPFLLGCEMVQVARVMPPQRIVPLPRVRGAVAGVFNFRGAITAAIDLRSLLNLPAATRPVFERIVLVKGNEFRSGLLIEKMLGMEVISSNSLKESVESAEEGSTIPVKGEFSTVHGTIRLLHIPQLLSLPEVIVNH
jgi:purine-binding chemotaxis protein CheW